MSQNNYHGYNPRPAGQRPVQQRPGQRPAGQRPPYPAQQPMRQRPAAPRPTGGGGFWKLALIGVIVIVLGLALQVLMPKGFPVDVKKKNTAAPVEAVTEIHSSGPVRINELMTSNGGVLTDEYGETPDWIEIMNVSNASVNLEGYTLSKSASGGNVFTFPDLVLEGGECVIVFADSHVATAEDTQFHAPFRLSSSGDVLMLFNSAKVAVDTVNIPAIARNSTYARRSARQWDETTECTPGLPNTAESYASLTGVTIQSPLRITEVMTSNTTVNPDENGVFHDYIIITNTGAEPVDISGWYLSDSLEMTRMWMFPEGTVAPAGGTITVHASGFDRSASGHLHAGFRLSSEGETIALSNDNGQPVDIAVVPLLKDNEVFRR